MFPLQNWNQKSDCQRNYNQKKVKIYLRDTKKKRTSMNGKNKSSNRKRKANQVCSILFWVYVMFVYANRHLCLCAWVRTQTRTPLCRLYSCLRLCLCLCSCVCVCIGVCEPECMPIRIWIRILSPESWILNHRLSKHRALLLSTWAN